MNNLYGTSVEVSFNLNVMEKVFSISFGQPDEYLMQEVTDNLIANMSILLTALDPRSAGELFGQILTLAGNHAAKAKKMMELGDAIQN
jgi:hypothetical protein